MKSVDLSPQSLLVTRRSGECIHLIDELAFDFAYDHSTRVKGDQVGHKGADNHDFPYFVHCYTPLTQR